MQTITEGRLQVIDAALPEFHKATSEQLGYIFQQYDPKHRRTLIAIPKSYLVGEGKGYLADIVEHMADDYFGVVTVPMYRYSVPINESVVFIANFDFLGKRKPAVKHLAKTVGFLRHKCNIPMSRVKQNVDLVSQEFLLSAGKLFSPRNEWRERTPIVQDKKTDQARLMTDKECLTLFGSIQPKEHVPINLIVAMAKTVK